MAKRLSLLLLVTAILLTTCTGKETPIYGDEPVTITFACMDYERSLYESLVAGFHTVNPHIRVQLVSADEASRMQTQQKGNTMTGTSDGKEVERLASSADTFVRSALLRPTDYWFLLDLQPFLDASAFPADDFFPGTLDIFRWQGRLYGLPAEVTPHLIFYDKRMFDQAGVPYPYIGWTWDDFLDTATRLTEREESRVTRFGFAERSRFLLAMMQQHGVSLWDEAVSPNADPPRPRFNTPEAARVLRRYTDMILIDKIMAGREVVGASEILNLIKEGKAAMWTDYAQRLQAHSWRTDVGIAPFPEEITAANPRSVDGFFISAGTAHPHAAWHWLIYLSENYQPFSDGVLPARRSVAEQMIWWEALDEETRAVFEYALAHPSTDDIQSCGLLRWAAKLVFENNANVEEALAAAQEEALQEQSELAEALPLAARPVATLRPTPAEAQTIIAFALSPDADMSVYRALVTVFQENHPDIQIEIIPASADLAELATTADCFGGMFSIHTSEMRRHIRNLEPLLEADTDFEPDDTYPQFLETFQHNGELWGLPYQANALMVYYNRALLAEAGVTPPRLAWSFDDFLDIAVALSKDGQYGFTTREGAYGDLIFVLERMEAHLFDDTHEPPTPTFDDPTVVAALGRYADLFHAQPLSPRSPSTQSGWPDAVVGGNHPAGVQTEQVAMWIDSLEFHADGPPLPFETGVAPLPGGLRTGTEFNVRAYYISAHTDKPAACWEWLTFLSRQPEVVQLLPARRSVATSPSWQSQVDEATLPAYQATLEYNDALIFHLRFEIPWLAYTYPWLDEAFQATVAGDDVGWSLAKAQRKAEAYILCLEREEGFANAEILRTCAREVDPDYPSFGE